MRKNGDLYMISPKFPTNDFSYLKIDDIKNFSIYVFRLKIIFTLIANG